MIGKAPGYERPGRQSDCNVLHHPLLVSLSDQKPPRRASFDQLMMSGKGLCGDFAIVPTGQAGELNGVGN